ncbi:MAG TPA: hypothetical protein VKM94_22005 [Blastocatellia bacterium]|nr:hypothetical protein [Blastocatellia bacterium]
MKTNKRLKLPVWLAVINLLMVVALPGMGSTSGRVASGRDPNPPPFDFTDNFYHANGINAANIRERVGNPDRNPTHWVVDNSNTDPNRRNIRVLETTGGFNNSGNLIYYSIMGTAFPNTFDRDANGNLTAAGQIAFNIANSFRAFLFPKASAGSILSPAPPNRRQDNIFDTRNGYFSNNPLGLWILAFVVYTPRAFTDEGRKVLDPIAAVNGRDLDGTPILTSASLIDNLAAQGLVEIRNRPLDGSQGFPWVI